MARMLLLLSVLALFGCAGEQLSGYPIPLYPPSGSSLGYPTVGPVPLHSPMALDRGPIEPRSEPPAIEQPEVTQPAPPALGLVSPPVNQDSARHRRCRVGSRHRNARSGAGCAATRGGEGPVAGQPAGRRPAPIAADYRGERRAWRGTERRAAAAGDQKAAGRAERPSAAGEPGAAGYGRDAAGGLLAPDSAWLSRPLRRPEPFG